MMRRVVCDCAVSTRMDRRSNTKHSVHYSISLPSPPHRLMKRQRTERAGEGKSPPPSQSRDSSPALPLAERVTGVRSWEQGYCLGPSHAYQMGRQVLIRAPLLQAPVTRHLNNILPPAPHLQQDGDSKDICMYITKILKY
jgi:hypothetical protein